MWQALKAFFSTPLVKAGTLTAVKVWQVVLALTVVAGAVGTYSYVRFATARFAPQRVIVFIGGLNTSMTNCHEDTFDDDTHSQILAFLLSQAAGIANPYAQGCNGLNPNQSYLSAPASMMHFSYNGGVMDSHGFWQPRDYQACSSVNIDTLTKDVQTFDKMLDDYRTTFPNARFTIVGHSLGGLVGLQGAYDYIVNKGNADIDKVVTIDSPLKGVQLDNSTLTTAESKLCIHNGPVVISDLVSLGTASLHATHQDVQCNNPKDPRQAILSWCKGQQLAQRGVGVVTLGNEQDSLYCGGSTQTLAGLDFHCYTQMLGTAHLVLSKVYDLPPLPSEGFAGTSLGAGHFTLISTPARELDIVRYILAPVVTMHQPALPNASLTSAIGTVLPFSATVRCLWGSATHASVQIVLEDGSTKFVGTSTATDRSDTLAINGVAYLPASLKNTKATLVIEAGGNTCQYLAGADLQIRANTLPRDTDYFGGVAVGMPFTLTAGSHSTLIAPSFPVSSTTMNDATLLAQSATLTVRAGQTFDVYFDNENTGTATWTDTGGYQFVCNTNSMSGVNCMGGIAQGLSGVAISPGDQGTFYVTLNAPLKAGTYQIAWSMAQKGVNFGQSQVGIKVIVTKPVTVQMPPTQTSCPAAGTARAAVIAPLALGDDPNIVYAQTTTNADGSLSAALNRYDMKTGHTAPIASIEEATNLGVFAEVSSDGQWVIFASDVNGSPAIQMVRMDGQGLQTLYCLPPTGASYPNALLQLHLSPDQKHLAFLAFTEELQSTFSLLDMITGKLQTMLQPRDISSSGFYQPVMWFNNTQLYLLRFPIAANALFLLNTQSGPNQSMSTLTQVTGFITTFALSPDRTHLFTGICQVCGQGIFIGPSLLSVQPASGTVQQTILTTPGAIDTLLTTSNDTLVFSVASYSQSPDRPADTSHDGVWKIHADGTGLTRLFGAGVNLLSISPDGRWCVVTSNSGVIVAPLDGGAPMPFPAGTNTNVVGWTMM